MGCCRLPLAEIGWRRADRRRGEADYGETWGEGWGMPALGQN